MESGSRRLKVGLLCGRKTESRCYLADKPSEVKQRARIESIRVVLDDVITADNEVAPRVSDLVLDVHCISVICGSAGDRDWRVLEVARYSQLKRLVGLI